MYAAKGVGILRARGWALYVRIAQQPLQALLQALLQASFHHANFERRGAFHMARLWWRLSSPRAGGLLLAS